jgi:transposase-like protein
MKKKYTPAFKAKVVRELLREDKSLRELASQYGIAPSQLSTWKTTAMERFESLFESERRRDEKTQVDRDREVNDLYAEIGRLTTQLAWIKKKSGLDA